MCKKAKLITRRSPSRTFVHSVFDSTVHSRYPNLYIMSACVFLRKWNHDLGIKYHASIDQGSYIWPLVIFSLVSQPGTFLKAILKLMQETTCSSSHFPVAGTGKLKLSSSLASSCALILILTSCEGGFDSCCGEPMRGRASSQTPASSFLSPELEPKITVPGE